MLFIMGGLRRVGKLFLISGSLLAGGSTVLYYSDALNNQWCSSFRVVRFGRAANAVSGHNNYVFRYQSM